MGGDEHSAPQHDTPKQQHLHSSSRLETQATIRTQDSHNTDTQPSLTGEDGRVFQARPPHAAQTAFGLQYDQSSGPKLYSGSTSHDQQYDPSTSRQLASQHGTHQQQTSSYAQGSMLHPAQHHASNNPPPHYQQRGPALPGQLIGHSSGATFLQPSDRTARLGIYQFMAPQANESQYSSLAERSTHMQPGENTTRSSTFQYIVPQTHGGHFSNMSSNLTPVDPDFAESSAGYSLFDSTNFPDLAMEEQEDKHREEATLEDEKAYFELQIRACFEQIISGKLNEARESVLSSTAWLISRVPQLGLHHDDGDAYEERKVMWAKLNHCWEALGLKQKDFTTIAQATGQHAEDIMTAESIVDLINRFIALCDQVEKYGLVDYEMGIWEEQIVAIFMLCLEQLAPAQRSSPSPSDQNQPT